MQFCDDCGSTMVKFSEELVCKMCGPDAVESATTPSGSKTPPQRSAALDELPTTDVGSVWKQHAMKWLSEPTDTELQNSCLPNLQIFWAVPIQRLSRTFELLVTRSSSKQ